MILQQLTIHNIASIEDATIDFEAQPLASSEVFLITGKTGAGKSTLLDAICLALYANTPRLDNTNMQGDTKDQDKDIKIKDPVQLMRRNTGEAFTKLTFTGSNGVHYKAIWSVARARNKVTGKIQQKKWSLRNLDTDFTYSKDKEIREEIARAIGLDFKQFCRTTLLAQGEFTRFLNSKDDDKAEILEKITGVDAYSKIGIKIFEKTSEKKQAWEDARQKTEGITLLSDEEIAEKKAELDNLTQQAENIKKETEKNRLKRLWIEKKQELQRRQTWAKEEKEKAQMALSDDREKENERIINLWNSTINARSWLHDMEMRSAHIQQQENVLQNLEKSFQLLHGAQVYEQEAEKHIHQQIKQIDDFIQANQPKVRLYENAQSIHGYMRIIEEGRKKISTYQKDMLSLNKQLLEICQPELSKAQGALSKSQKSLHAQEQALLQEDETLAALQLPTLRHQNDALKTLVNRIDAAQSLLNHLQEDQQRQQEAQRNILNLIDKIKEKKAKSESMSQQVHDAEIEKNTAKAIYEKQRESINQWAKSIRLQLHIGDICPVCQQKLTSELPHEDSLHALVATAEKEAKDAELKYNQLTNVLNALNAEILALTEQYKNDHLSLEKGKSMLSQNEQKTKIAIDACKLTEEEASYFLADEIGYFVTNPQQRDSMQQEDLNHRKAKILSFYQNIEKKIATAESKEKQVKILQNNTEKLRKQVDHLKDATILAEKKKEHCQHQIDNVLSLLNSKATEVSDAESNAASLIGSTEWNASPLAFAQEILQAATLYNRYQEAKQQKEKDLERYQSNNQNIDIIMQNILRMMPSWTLSTSTPTDTKSIAQLLEKATKVQSLVAAALHQIKQEKTEQEKNQKLLDDFICQQEAEKKIDIHLLKELNTYSQEDIAERTRHVSQVKLNLSNKETLLQEAAKAYQSHQEKAKEAGFTDVDFNDFEATMLSLNAQQLYLETEQRELSDKRGGIMRDLEINQVNLQKIGDLKKEEEEKKAEYTKWNRLNQLLGDATGNKFRRIAQSYVLASLIHSANSYMRTLSDRYTLRVVPGTFVITLEDAYQGYANRAASTLSGGESFLVSLSLALALSDIGNQLAVDTLFIDEGFGTLSGDPLQHAINTLRSLHTRSGRHVGIISHVEELKERIPVQIQVNQEGNNSSSTLHIVG